MKQSTALVRYAALRRRRRRERQQELPLASAEGVSESFRQLADEAVLPALVDSARSRLPARAGPFHKGTLTLNALSALAASDPRSAARLVERYRRLVRLQRALGLHLR